MPSPFGEPPIDINLGENHTPRNNATVVCMFGLAATAVALRVIARVRVQHAPIAADDWFIFAAMLPVMATLVCTVLGGTYGLGRHAWVVPLDNVIVVMQVLFAYVLIYIFTIPLIKMSIICFYRRIFGMNAAMWFCIFLTLGYCVACTITFLSCCRPLSYYWTQYRDSSGGKCVFDLYSFYIGNAVANVVTDVIILLVPIPLIWKLQMRTTLKVMISSIFILGGFVCIASLVRIYFMTFLKSSVDITWIMGDVFIWSSVEPCVGILCACLPTIRPLLRSAFRRLLGSLKAEQTFGPSSSDADVNELHHRQLFERPVSIGHCSPLEATLNSGDKEMVLLKSVTNVEVI
ncbi:uncharacterized protein LDX57_002850 [Aspergillus melleus]|uniref:uncharacterized protein n=1 Tax=Aspergillus melleus TaxID=138277 RepID=UPI001E8DF5B4|nr:uncharacterized protein LDX57_002850 [Aspergillus melleus]KAH8425101.1 hypothetical protein LDX57_002850 [Aspergillus melleus]